jgi:hypothetical protein
MYIYTYTHYIETYEVACSRLYGSILEVLTLHLGPSYRYLGTQGEQKRSIHRFSLTSVWQGFFRPQMFLNFLMPCFGRQPCNIGRVPIDWCSQFFLVVAQGWCTVLDRWTSLSSAHIIVCLCLSYCCCLNVTYCLLLALLASNFWWTHQYLQVSSPSSTHLDYPLIAGEIHFLKQLKSTFFAGDFCPGNSGFTQHLGIKPIS